MGALAPGVCLPLGANEFGEVLFQPLPKNLVKPQKTVENPATPTNQNENSVQKSLHVNSTQFATIEI
jgi:hypothetical protein